MRTYFVYMLANRPGGTLYIGVTSNLFRRIQEHKDSEIRGFTQRYGLKILVYVEQTSDVHAALQREKRLKALETRVENCVDRKREPSMERSHGRFRLGTGSLLSQG